MSACRISDRFLSRFLPGFRSVGSCQFWRSAPAFTATPSFRRLLVLAAATASSEVASPDEEPAGDLPEPVVRRTSDASLAPGPRTDFADSRWDEPPFEPWTTLLARDWACETN
ncbi:MAG TPA: hypothetical protein DD670_00380 [Planctomycetaceae bacterium]|nr:hypothetical protein [Planctomycetaceae bacterium]